MAEMRPGVHKDWRLEQLSDSAVAYLPFGTCDSASWGVALDGSDEVGSENNSS